MAEKLYIEEATIKNFRILQNLHATDFGQVNLITGRNNSGKTTFLEALFLSLGPANPQLWINLNNRRGLRRISKKETTIPYLFNNLDTTTPIKINIVTKNHRSYILSISEIIANSGKNIIQEKNDLGSSKDAISTRSSNANKGLEIRFQPIDGEPIISRAMFSKDSIYYEGENLDVIPTSIYLSSESLGDLETDAKRYDELNKKGLVHKFEEALKPILPNLKRTSLGIENDIPMVFADVGFGLVPISLLGSGSKRLVAILLAFIQAKDAIVLIDEVEYGFHHSLLRSVWESIRKFSNLNHVQVFATTHSNECIRAASDIFTKKPDFNFKLHRMSQEEKSSVIKSFSINQLDIALQSELDVR